jgi:uncharacterized membrane protein YbhN (UPF0104 family)
MTDAPSDAPVPTRGGSPLRRRAGYVAGLLALGLLAAAVYRQWDEFTEALSSIRPQTLVLASVAVLLGLLCNSMSWRATMASVDAAVPVVAGARVFFLSQLGKYIPGSVWPVLAQVELAKERGISRARSATAALVAMLVGVVTSSVLGATLVIASQGDAFRRYWWLLAVSLVGLATLYPPVLRRLMALAARLLRRPTFDVPVSGRHLAVADLWSVVMWVLFGVQAWLLALDLAPGEVPSFPVMTGAFALSWVVGFLFVLAPAGVGVREAALVVALGGALTPAGALALALVSRIIMTGGDALLAGLSALGGRVPRAPARPGAAGDPTAGR